MRRRRRALHLHREPGARIHRVNLAIRVRDLRRVDRVERHADAHAIALPARLLHEDELALARLGNVAEEGGVVVVLALRPRGPRRGNGVGGAYAVQHAIVEGRGHGGPAAAEGGGGRVGRGVAGEGVVGADVIGACGGLTVGGCMVMVLLLLDVTIVNCEERHHISLRTIIRVAVQKQVLHCGTLQEYEVGKRHKGQ